MSIQLVTYANQTVTPTNDAIIYERAIDQNGIFYGCNVTVTSNTVNITGGYGIVCGREFVINSDSLTVTLAPSGTLQGRLYVRLDLADADAPIQLLTATGNTLPALTQDADVNYTNGVYEMELATFTVGVSALSDVVETCETIIGSKEITANLREQVSEAHYTTFNQPAGTANGSIAYQIIGKSVIFAGSVQCTSSQATGTTLFSNFPIPAGALAAFRAMNSTTGAYMDCYINSDGTFRIGGATGVGWLRFAGAYIIQLV